MLRPIELVWVSVIITIAAQRLDSAAGVLEPTYDLSATTIEIKVNPANTMRSVATLLALLLCLSIIPSSQGGQAEQLDIGFTFGGNGLDANQSGNSSSSLADLPAIVEYYTATWCANCVEVEHALDNIEQSVNIQQFHFHRNNDSEDPWGTDAGEGRWNARYDGGIAPTVVFNGSIKQIGSVAQDETLEADYTSHANEDLSLGVGTSTLGWVLNSDNVSGTATWNLVVDQENLPLNSTVSSMIWITERFGNFPEGGNGVEDYPHIVRGVIELGQNASGTIEIDLPTPHDDNDLQIFLVHQVNLPEGEEPEETEEQNDPVSPSDGLPNIGFIGGVLALVCAALLRRSD